MKFSCFFFFLLTTGLFFRLAAQNRPIDTPIDKYDLVWSSPSRDAGESMPCGGGDIGLNVWVEKGDLLFYFARSSSFDENNALLKGGRIRVRLSPNPLEGSAFQQKLTLNDGSILITGTAAGVSVQIRAWVDVYRPAIHLEINSSSPLAATASYESWRTADRIMTGKANNANSYKWASRQAPGGQVITYKDSIRFQQEGVLFYHRNRPGPSVFDVTVHQQGLDAVKSQLTDPLKDLTFGGLLKGSGMRPAGTVPGRYLDTDFTGWRLVSERPARSRRIDLFLATAQTATIADWETALQQAADDAIHHASTARTATAAWWDAFWRKSFISIGADTATREWQAGRNYQLFRYMLGCNAYGQYPTKFNGGLFTYDPSLTDTSLHATPDFRNWGGGTMTAQNQRLVYFPMIRSGDFELMRPQFDFYLRGLQAAELRTVLYWGHKGACYTEQLENFGLPNNAEYGWDMPAGHDKGVEYNAWLEYEWDTVLEFCLMMLETERYTDQDISGYLPFIQSCLEFFNEHYQYLARERGRKSLDGAGHLILYPGSGAETYKMAYNSSSTIAGLHTVLTRLLELPAHYLTDSARQEWTTMLNRLPPLSFRNFDGHPTIAPAQLWERLNNKESPQLYPVFPWGLYGVGRPGLDTAINTWKYDTDAVKFRSYVGWKQDNIFAARLGLTNEAATLTLQKLQNSGRRFPAFWGPGFDWTPDHNWGGSGMIGLQEMLLQTDGKKIFLFPAWPRDWDVHFKLYAPYSTTVEATLKNGKVTQLTVLPEQRRKDIISAF
jgi:Domain of unknown function (DUF5703)